MIVFETNNGVSQELVCFFPSFWGKCYTLL